MSVFRKLKQRASKNNPWLTIQDVIGDARLWPLYIREIFWCSELTYVKRLKVAAFCYQNGCPPGLCCETLRFTCKGFKIVDACKIHDLYKWWVDNPDKRSRYYAFSMYDNKGMPL